jgi:hypothetical protein
MKLTELSEISYVCDPLQVGILRKVSLHPGKEMIGIAFPLEEFVKEMVLKGYSIDRRASDAEVNRGDGGKNTEKILVLIIG